VGKRPSCPAKCRRDEDISVKLGDCRARARTEAAAIIGAGNYFERAAGDGPAKNRKKWESGSNTSRVLSGRNPAS
jgi:hypothetical protein